MASIAAKEVAYEVLETVRKGKRPILGKIIRKKGYALTTSTVPSQVTNTKSYQGVIKPLVLQLEEERQAIMARLPKVRSKAKYRDLMDGLDKVTKTHQLLTGGSTENVAVLGNAIVFEDYGSSKTKSE